MDFMASTCSTMEGTLATAFRKAVRSAIADLIDDGGRQSRTDDEEPEQEQRVEKEQPHINSIRKLSSSSIVCSPYDTLYWLGGDCMRETAATSLATITECATMKTDNTTEMTALESQTKGVLAIVSPAKSSGISSTSSNDDRLQHCKNANDSISSNDMNTNANADIISQYHQQYNHTEVETNGHRLKSKDSKSLFDDYADYTDYTDPMNSILVEDHPDDHHKSNSITNSFCGNATPEPKAEESLSTSSTVAPISSWCGGYPSLLMYNTYDDDYLERQKSDEPYPDYYADFKPQRQYAFDEEDGEDSGSALRTNALVDGISSTDEAATTNDGGNTVLTSVGSIQSFMVINRPHTTHPSSIPIVTPLTKKLQKHKRSHDSRLDSRRITPEHGDHHLHKLIASPGPGGMASQSLPDSDDSDKNPFDYALTQSLMRKLQKHLPYGKRGDSFWLQYSLIRDGASLDSLLEMVHRDANTVGGGINSNNTCSVLAIETVEGEVFGAFLTQTWRRSCNQWYGGGQSFLWTTSSSETNTSTERNTNNNNSRSKADNLRIFPYSFGNSYVQLCDRDRLLVGGGDSGDKYERHCYGFGLALERDLLRGSSCPCTTFESPSLSKFHSDGSTFEIRNVEVWTLTPCLSIIDNPSEGMVRVHNREKQKTTREEKQPKGQHTTGTIVTSTTPTSNESDENNENLSLHDFYSCSRPDCHSIQIDDDDITEDFVRDLAARSFPGAYQTVARNRDVRRHNSQRRKNRTKYVGPTSSLP